MEKYMREALELAREAARAGEVPVGCVVFDESGRIIGRGRNRARNCPTPAPTRRWRPYARPAGRGAAGNLTGCGIAVTLEPCPMCAGAIINARLSTVAYGAREARSGSVGSVINLFEENYGHRPRVYGGVLRGRVRRGCSRSFSDGSDKNSTRY